GIRMARENYLAQRDGYGQALVFLHPDDASANVYFLDRYLLKLQIRAMPRPLVNEARQAVELAAHYVADTGWCRGEPAARYVHLANKLCKHAGSEICRLALRSIATEVLRPGALAGLREGEAALLSNALSKAPEHLVCCEAVSALAGHVRLRGLAGRLNAQNISNLLNALS
ncbi:hypothetical protein, partial [Paraburkholderia sp. UYCP14C]|uniref:hypothetical protein n=1 Tax=Paraburkholderia sp. UYCP14C TaxID=2511130 RepID=UPI001459FC4B